MKLRLLNKIINNLFNFFLFIFIILIVFPAYSQKDENERALSQMDISSFSDKAFLNKAIVVEEMLEPFRKKRDKEDSQFIQNVSAVWFNELFKVLERADLKDRKVSDKVSLVLGRSRKEVTSNNIIPIGVINSEAVLLTEEQVNDNIKAKASGKTVDGSNYEQFEMILPGLLQDEIFQGDVQFQVSPELVFSNITNKIEFFEIDFKDGKRPSRYPFRE